MGQIRSRVALAAAALAAAALAGAALVPQTAAAQEISACAGQGIGVLRLVAAGTACRSGETPVSWNVQGPQGPVGPAGPAGPQGPTGTQAVLAAAVLPDGSVQALTAPTGATFTITRTGPGAYQFQVSGLGTACPLPTASAFSGPTVMWFGSGSCGSGTLDLSVHAGNGVDTTFLLHVIGLGPASATAAAAKAAVAPSRAVTLLGQ